MGLGLELGLGIGLGLDHGHRGRDQMLPHERCEHLVQLVHFELPRTRCDLVYDEAQQLRLRLPPPLRLPLLLLLRLLLRLVLFLRPGGLLVRLAELGLG